MRLLAPRRAQLPRLLAIAGLIGVLLAVAAAPADARRTVYRGQWQCDDRGHVMALGGIEVQLWRRGDSFWPVEWVGSIVARRHTDEEGNFELRARHDSEGVDDHFIRMALRDAAGVRLKDFWGINDCSQDSGSYRNDVAARYIGGLRLSTPGQAHKCAVWRGFHDAHREFRALMGVNPPSGGLLIQADAVTAGVPYAPHQEVMWPSGPPSGSPGWTTTAKHEFGHTVRHGYDGDYTHFFGDVFEHNYLQQHENCNKTGFGFAFNEGWAEYWAGWYGPAPECPGRPPDDYEVEGNVGFALADIEARCYGGNRAAMVDILRANPGRIHSYREFLSHVICPAPLLVTFPVYTEPQPRTISTSEAAKLARTQVDQTDRALRGLRVQLRRAVRAAKRPARCAKSCSAALRRATLPAVLRAEIALAQLARRALDDADTVAEQRRLRKLSMRAAQRRMRARETSNRRAAAKISADGIRDALRASRRVFARDGTRATRRLRARLLARMRSFRSAQKRSSAPAGVVLGEAVAGRVRRVKTRPFPNPRPPQAPAPIPIPFPNAPPPPPAPAPPPPPVDTREASTLTLTCPQGGQPGLRNFTGTLSPSHPGAGVELHVTPPFGPAQIKPTKTDPQSFLPGRPRPAGERHLVVLRELARRRRPQARRLTHLPGADRAVDAGRRASQAIRRSAEGPAAAKPASARAAPRRICP